MTDYARQLLIQCLTEQGHDKDLAEQTVASILGAQIASGMVSPKHLDDWEREAHVWHLRGRGLTAQVIHARTGVPVRSIFNSIRRHGRRRRAALRAA